MDSNPDWPPLVRQAAELCAQQMNELLLNFQASF